MKSEPPCKVASPNSENHHPSLPLTTTISLVPRRVGWDFGGGWLVLWFPRGSQCSIDWWDHFGPFIGANLLASLSAPPSTTVVYPLSLIIVNKFWEPDKLPHLSSHRLIFFTSFHRLVIPSPFGVGDPSPPYSLSHRASLDPVNLEAPALLDLSSLSLKSALKLAFLSIRPPAFFRAQGLQSFLGHPSLLLHPPPCLLSLLGTDCSRTAWVWALGSCTVQSRRGPSTNPTHPVK